MKLLELAMTEVGIFGARQALSFTRQPQPQDLITVHTGDQCRHPLHIAWSHDQRRLRRPLDQMAYSSSNARHAKHSSLEHGKRASFVARTDNIQIRSRQQRPHFSLSQKSMKAHTTADPQLRSERLHLAVQGILAYHVELSPRHLRQSTQQAALVLYTVEAGHLHEAQRGTDHARSWFAEREFGEVHAQRQALTRMTQRSQLIKHRPAGRRQHISAAQHQGLAQATAPRQAAAIADVVQGHQFATGHMHRTRQPEQLCCKHSHESGGSRPDRLNEFEAAAPVLLGNGPQGKGLTQRHAGPTDVVHARAAQPPLARIRFLPQSEHMHLVQHGKALEQSQQSRHNPHLARAIHTAWHHDRDFQNEPSA
ncbi:hypothetical protein LNV28_10025 [Paucibacter sp. DJ2R-2]|nr:hypothetical protein [Paucibacter sp. DJ2R-2]MCV2438633.1 hypothetical protein [Paucibacter sp. DJ2R-2]